MHNIENELIIPVYLNQRIVFDMIAMLQGGIATVTRITSTESSLGKEIRGQGQTLLLSFEKRKTPPNAYNASRCQEKKKS